MDGVDGCMHVPIPLKTHSPGWSPSELLFSVLCAVLCVVLDCLLAGGKGGLCG